MKEIGNGFWLIENFFRSFSKLSWRDKKYGFYKSKLIEKT